MAQLASSLGLPTEPFRNMVVVYREHRKTCNLIGKSGFRLRKRNMVRGLAFITRELKLVLGE